VPEDGLQLLELQRRRDTKHTSISVKTSVRQKDVAVRIEPEEVAEGLDGDDRAGDGLLFRNSLLHKNFQGFPCAAAETREKFSVVKKIPAQDFGDAENEMPVRNFLEDIHAEPLSEFHHALLMAGRAEMAPFAGEGQQILVATVITSDAGKAVFQIAAVEVTADHLFDIRPPEAVIP